MIGTVCHPPKCSWAASNSLAGTMLLVARDHCGVGGHSLRAWALPGHTFPSAVRGT